VFRRFEVEARTAAMLRHPASVRLLDFGTTDRRRPYLVTEFIEGPTLEALAGRSRGLPLPEALGLIESLACALDEAHAKGIVHRDVKPANVLVERIGRRDYPKLIDWGIAKLRSVSVSSSPGTLIGTPAFMAPEQARSEAVTPATDLHALGALFFFALTGRPPFEAARLHELLREIASGPRCGLPDVGAGALHGELDRLYLSMVAIDPHARPASAWLVAEEVRRIHGYLSPGSVGHHVDHTMEMPSVLPILPTVEAATTAIGPERALEPPSGDVVREPVSEANRRPTVELEAMLHAPRQSRSLVVLAVSCIVLFISAVLVWTRS
jgi:serine/threonine protein kinase